MVNRSKLVAELENWEQTVVEDSRSMHVALFDRDTVLSSVAQAARNIASINYQLDNLEQARLWFAWEVRALSEFVLTIDVDSNRDKRVGVPQYLENAVVHAILIGQPQLREEAIESVDKIDPEIREAVDWDPRFHMVRLFVALAKGDDDHVSDYAETVRDRADDLPEDDAEWRDYFHQLVTAAEAIVGGEADVAERELDALLALSDDVAREMYDGSDVMDHRSGALVVLARERGLPVEPEGNEYLPTDLIELVAPLEDVA